MKIGPLHWLGSDDYFRPSLWIHLPRSCVVVFFGWQWPSVLWLKSPKHVAFSARAARALLRRIFRIYASTDGGES